MTSDKEQLQKVKEFLDKPLFGTPKKTKKEEKEEKAAGKIFASTKSGKKLRLGVKADIRSFF